jgi:hypothetical protein
MKTQNDEMITKELLNLFSETFIEVNGKYLDNGTTLFETIEKIPANKASYSFKGFNETIAGHVNHIMFYIIVMMEYTTGKRTGKTDWNESWEIKEVTEDEWGKLKEKLRVAYLELVGFINGIDEWNNEDYFGVVISILAHCSYHLGAIRQMINLKME